MEDIQDVKFTKVWGIKFSLIAYKQFLNILDFKIRNNLIPIHITGVNPETVVLSFKHIKVRDSINDSDLVNVDNYLVLLTLRILGYHAPCRIATPDLFESLLEYSNKNCFRIFILGAKQKILDQAVINIKRKYINIDIECNNGFFSQNDEKLILDKIKLFKPDMVFIAMPSPYKESFILNYKKEINAKVFLGIGGAIDVKAGVIKRAPKILRELGFEGLHRSFQNPLNYGKRIFEYYPEYFKIAIREKNGK